MARHRPVATAPAVDDYITSQSRTDVRAILELRFPPDAPMPYPLIRRVVRARLAEHRLRRAAKRRTR